MIELLVSLAVFGLPLVVGYVLARRKPAWGPFRISFIASLPMGLCFLIGAMLLRMTVAAPTCAEPPCTDPAPLYFWALAIWGIVAMLVGFGLGMVGHAMGAKKNSKA